MTNDVVRILSVAIARKASDIHLSVGRPPILRVNGELCDLPDAPALDAESCREMVYSSLSEAQRARLGRISAGLLLRVPGLPGAGDVLYQRGSVQCALRAVPWSCRRRRASTSGRAR